MLFQVIKFVVIDRTEHNSQLEDSPQLYFSWVKEWNPHLLILEEDEILFLGLSTLLGMSFLYLSGKQIWHESRGKQLLVSELP